MTEIRKVDAIGEACPIPVIKAKKALDTADSGDVIEVHVDNEIAVQNLMRMAKSRQCGFESEMMGEKHFAARITVKEGTKAENQVTGTVAEAGNQIENRAAGADMGTQDCSCQPVWQNHTVVVINSAAMGTGNDELGKVLMKGFLYALSQLDELPEKILFYNGGVTLTTEGSDSLEDLKSMAEQGVEIYSCGTCLDYYGLKSKLKVGEVTNMYSIVEAMAESAKIIRP